MNQERENLLFLLFGVSAGIAMAVAVYFIVPSFQEMFVNFDAKLPLATNLLLATFRWWGVVPVVTFALWALWPNPSKRGIAALVFGTVSAAVLFLFVLFALYAPIFQLAAIEG
jgi:type II secretory pathway component PulF